MHTIWPLNIITFCVCIYIYIYTQNVYIYIHRIYIYIFCVYIYTQNIYIYTQNIYIYIYRQFYTMLIRGLGRSLTFNPYCAHVTLVFLYNQPKRSFFKLKILSCVCEPTAYHLHRQM